MAFVFKTLLTLLAFITILQDVYLLPIDHNLNQLRTTKSPVLSYDKNSGDFLVRIKKESVKIGTCPRGKERYKGKCRTLEEIKRLRDNDFDDNVTEPAVYEVVPLIPKGIVQEPVTVQEDFSPSTTYDTWTSTVALPEVTDSQLESTESTLDANSEEVHAVSPTLIFKDENVMDSERMNNLTYTFLMICSVVVVLTCLLKLLYDWYLRRNDDTVSHLYSTDDMLCGSTTSRCRLCS